MGCASMTLLPNFSVVEIYNMSDDDYSAILSSRQLTVNSEDGTAICSGKVEDIYFEDRESNVVAIISVSDGQDFWEMRVNESIGAGAYLSGAVSHIMKAATMGTWLARDFRVIRAQTFVGRLADAISALAKSVDARAFISMNVVHVVEKGKAETVVNIPESDVIQGPNYAEGLCMLKTVVGGYPVGVFANYNGATYRIISQRFDADNFDGPWETTLFLADESLIDDGGMGGG